jgi:hypothetical protein
MPLPPGEPASPEAVAAWIGEQRRARDRFAHTHRASEEHRAAHGPHCTVYPSGSGPILGALAAATGATTPSSRYVDAADGLALQEA